MSYYLDDQINNREAVPLPPAPQPHITKKAFRGPLAEEGDPHLCL